MPKGGRTRTTWNPAWKSGRTTVIRVPQVFADELLRIARLLDEGGTLPITGKKEAEKRPTLREAAQQFLMTVQPHERNETKGFLDRFLKNLDE